MDISYLLVFALVLLPVLMTYVFFQNPRGRVNRLFALYMLSLTLTTYTVLVLCTTANPNLAGAAAVALLISNYALNGSFLVSLVLEQFYPRYLLRWYGLPLFMSISALLSAILLSDGVFRTDILYTPSPELGQDYVRSTRLLTGLGGLVVRPWFFLSIVVAVILLVAAWIRDRPGERAPASLLIFSVLVVGGTMPFLPDSPLTPIIPALFFPVAFTIVVARYRLFLPAEIALETVFHSTIEGAIICDRNGRVDLVNPAAERLTGISAGKAIAHPFAEAFASFLERAQEEGETPLAEAVATGISEPFETILRLESPNLLVLRAAAIPIHDEHGRHLGCLLSLRDITERERTRLAMETQARLAETIRELSTPIIPVMEGILILPLIGSIDSERAHSIMRDLLTAISQHRARAILIDITGVPVVDTVVAKHLLQAVQASSLLGCQGILVGIRAEIARTLVELGLNLGDLVTRGSLQDGLKYAMGLVNPTRE